ncbi:MAG: hypothetical protein U0V04_02435 [Spirosomataceae bacterium]|jgi:hypothetical protein
MKQVILNVPDQEYSFFMKLIKSLKFVELAKSDQDFDPDFVSKIEKSRKEYQNGDFISVEKQNLESFLGLK